uniref:Uncharacterized protein n=1 Tax=Euplotes harpa TaxID=151035 RepID=A0A7S3JM33_9SPIT|mmetsp:Transcript_4757/g.5664  ORF Transcript_4757/g.5664 Transcript_4757/m.5664 type:complete len:120 (+) Transcript_4757:20-379(+)
MEREERRPAKGVYGGMKLQEISKDSLESLRTQVKKFKTDLTSLKSSLQSMDSGKNTKDIDFDDLEWADDYMASQIKEASAKPKPVSKTKLDSGSVDTKFSSGHAMYRDLKEQLSILKKM